MWKSAGNTPPWNLNYIYISIDRLIYGEFLRNPHFMITTISIKIDITIYLDFSVTCLKFDRTLCIAK